jgi:hypothetical protein
MDYIASNFKMIDELERMWEEAVVFRSSYYPRIRLQNLIKSKKNFNHGRLCPEWNSSLEPA